MATSFVIFVIFCLSGGIPVAVAVPLFGLADLVEGVLADEIADGPVAQAQEGRSLLQAPARGGQGLVDVFLGDLVEMAGQAEPRGEERLGLELLLLGGDDLLGQAVHGDRLAVLDGHDALDDVLQLTDVSRPGGAFEKPDDLGREPLGFLPILSQYFWRKWAMSKGMSSIRLRSGGMSQAMTLGREKRSSRNFPHWVPL